MGTWYLSLAASLMLILIGMYIHWSVVLIGLILPFIPMVSFVLTRRSARRQVTNDDDDGSEGGDGPH